MHADVVDRPSSRSSSTLMLWQDGSDSARAQALQSLETESRLKTRSEMMLSLRWERSSGRWGCHSRSLHTVMVLLSERVRKTSLLGSEHMASHGHKVQVEQEFVGVGRTIHRDSHYRYNPSLGKVLAHLGTRCSTGKALARIP